MEESEKSRRTLWQFSIPEKEKKNQQNTIETKTNNYKNHLNVHIIKKTTGSAF